MSKYIKINMVYNSHKFSLFYNRTTTKPTEPTCLKNACQPKKKKNVFSAKKTERMDLRFSESKD